jgi:hypothetical protein
MNSKHTPGPWRYCKENGSPTTGQHMIAGGKPGYLAEVRDCGSGCVEANARLIAAAPDLLAVLQELQECAEYWSEYDVPLGIVDRINAAIAKATGESANAYSLDHGLKTE